MSTKIFEAWRWQRQMGISPVLYQVEAIMKKQMYKKAQELLGGKSKDDMSATTRRALTQLCSKLTQFQALNPYRGPTGDFTCDFVVWDFKQYCYMFPVGSRNWDYSKIYKIPGLEDVRYWNNTDRPKGMTQRDWNRRAKIWDQQHEVRYILTKTVYHVLDPYTPSMDLYQLFDPRWATKEEKKRYGLPTCIDDVRAANRKALAKIDSKKKTKKKTKKRAKIDSRKKTKSGAKIK